MMAAMRRPNTSLGCLFFVLGLVNLVLFVDAGNAPLPAYPLAVRSPYLSTWISRKYTSNFPTAVPEFWAAQQLGWEVMAHVNNQTYTLFGFPETPDHMEQAKQNSVSFTSTHTLVNMTAGGVDFLLDFFSPVDPTNMLRQSLPFSYLTVGATSASARAQDVQIYSAIDDRWAGGSGPVIANLTQNDGTSMYIIENQEQLVFRENNNMAIWGQVVYGVQPTDPASLSYYCGASSDVYSAFVTGGGAFSRQAPSCSSGQIYAFKYDLGQVGSATVNTTFAIGQARDQMVNYHGEIRTGYAAAAYPTVAEAAVAFLKDYEAAWNASDVIDNLVRVQGQTVSNNYADILEASVRQTYGTLEITIDSNTLDTSDPLIFTKEISSDGNVNTVDYLYDALILFYMLDPNYIRLFTEPLLRYLTSSGPHWTNNYMVHDLGRHYPIADGHDDNREEYLGNRFEFMPLDSTSDIMTMVLAYQQVTNDTAWAKQYEPLLTTYADYLAANYSCNIPQLSTVDSLPTAANKTTLVVASAIGLGAFSQMFDAPRYNQQALDIVDEYYIQGKGLNQARTHFLYQNGRPEYEDTWTVMYPMYMDKLLNTNIFPDSAYTMMSNWYSQHMNEWGLQFKNSLEWGITDWNMWVSAIGPAHLQQRIINATHNFLTEPHNQRPFQTKYNVMGKNPGYAIANIARGTVSANFAILAVNGSWWGKNFTELIGSGPSAQKSSATLLATGLYLPIAQASVLSLIFCFFF